PGTGAAPPAASAASAMAPIARTLKNCISLAAALFAWRRLRRRRHLLRRRRALMGRLLRRFRSILRRIQPRLLLVRIQGRIAAVRGAAEEQLIGEALVGALHLGIVGGDLLADAIVRGGASGLRQKHLLAGAVIAGYGAGGSNGVSTIKRRLGAFGRRDLVERREARLGRLQVVVWRNDERRFGDDGEFIRRRFAGYEIADAFAGRERNQQGGHGGALDKKARAVIRHRKLPDSAVAARARV